VSGQRAQGDVMLFGEDMTMPTIELNTFSSSHLNIHLVR